MGRAAKADIVEREVRGVAAINGGALLESCQGSI
jgi:hypothetical protein